MTKLKTLLTIENKYNLLVQIDYLAGLLAATVLGLYLVGAVSWFIFVFLLVVSLGLGIITVRVYTKMMKSIMRGNKEKKE